MQVRVVSFQKHKRLSVVQLLTAQQNTVDYISGPKAIKDDLIQVKEVSESGSVNNLFVFNLSSKYVFLMDGDILMGAKQNRVLNTSVLLAPNSKITLPVSCVEQGRWSRVSAKFMNSDYITPLKLRAGKSRNVSENLRARSEFDAGQGEVWKNVEDYQVAFKVNSPSMSLADVYEKEKDNFEAFIKNFTINNDANGLALFSDRQLLNIDVFNRTDIYQEYFPKILRSTAMEISNLKDKKNDLEEVEALYKTQSTFDLLEKIEKTKHSGVAAGEESRFDSEDLTGFELNFKNQLIHLTALNIEKGRQIAPMVTEGIEFNNARPDEVIDYLQDLDRVKLSLSPANLKIELDGKMMILRAMDKKVRDYPIRKSFLHKLLRWYSFPMNQLTRLSNETLVSVCNDYLMNINRDFVNVTIEKGEALTITSPDYNEITDLEIIQRCTSLGVRTISRNDFMMRITTEERFKFQVVKGDACGIGLSMINSETGFRTLSIAHFVLRYVCSNGAIVRIGTDRNERMHYGYKGNELQEFLDKQVELALLSQKEIANSIKDLSNKPAVNFIESVSKKVEAYVGKYDSKNFFNELNDTSTLFDLFNMVTNKSKKYDLSKRVLLESLAGELMLN